MGCYYENGNQNKNNIPSNNYNSNQVDTTGANLIKDNMGNSVFINAP